MCWWENRNIIFKIPFIKVGNKKYRQSDHFRCKKSLLIGFWRMYFHTYGFWQFLEWIQALKFEPNPAYFSGFLMQLLIFIIKGSHKALFVILVLWSLLLFLQALWCERKYQIIRLCAKLCEVAQLYTNICNANITNVWNLKCRQNLLIFMRQK